MKIPVTVSLDESLVTATDRMRGQIPRSRIIEDLINAGLKRADAAKEVP